MKKRLLVLLMALAMCFAMFGCSSDDAQPEDATNDAPVDVQPEDTEAQPEDTEAQPEDTEVQPEDTEAQPE